jgi:hypothetical protein
MARSAGLIDVEGTERAPCSLADPVGRVGVWLSTVIAADGIAPANEEQQYDRNEADTARSQGC